MERKMIIFFTEMLTFAVLMADLITDESAKGFQL